MSYVRRLPLKKGDRVVVLPGILHAGCYGTVLADWSHSFRKVYIAIDGVKGDRGGGWRYSRTAVRALDVVERIGELA